mgnify:CR=1 FL=1
MPLWGVEMKLDTFAVPFTADRRMAYAAAYLEQCSYRQGEEVQAADFVLLPVPAKDYMLEGLDGKTVFLGGGRPDLTLFANCSIFACIRHAVSTSKRGQVD